MELLVFYLFGALAILTALAVVFLKKTVYAALALILCFASMAALYIQMEAHFLGAIQIIVYAGAIMVLFLFVIMLLDPQKEAILSRSRSRAILLAGVPMTAFVLYVLVRALIASSPDSSLGNLGQAGTIAVVAKGLFTQYLLPFELTGILILVAVIGAIMLAKSQD